MKQPLFCKVFIDLDRNVKITYKNRCIFDMFGEKLNFIKVKSIVGIKQ